MLHQVAAGVVDDDRVGHAVVEQFPRGKAGALVARSGLVDPDVDRQAGVVGEIDRRGGGAPVDGGEPAGVAMGEDVERPAGGLVRGEGAEQRQPGLADAAVDRDILIAKGGGEVARPRSAGSRRQRLQVRAGAVERPAEVDGGRPGREQRGVRPVQSRVGRIGAQSEPETVGGRRADERSAAHEHGPDGVGGLVERGQAYVLELVRQPRLVNDADGLPVRVEPDRPLRFAVNIHAEVSSFDA